MKKITLFMLLMVQNFLFAQTQDLVGLAKGDYLGFNAVFDQNDVLFGYVALYGYGKSGEKTKKFEYVLLDKNLNPVANKEFEGDITAADYSAYMDFKGNIVLRPSRIDYYATKAKDMFSPASMVVNLKDNTVEKKKYYDYENNAIKESVEFKNWNELRKNNKVEKKEKGYNYFSYVYEVKEGGFIVLEFNDYGSYINNNSLIRFDDEKKELWKYSYNTSGNKKNKEVLRIIEKDENYIYGILNNDNDGVKTFHLLVIDMKTGKEVVKTPIDKFSAKTIENITFLYGDRHEISNQKTFDDKIVLVGKFFATKDEELGFARLLIDKKTFQLDQQAFLYNELKEFIPTIDRLGYMEKGYKLSARDLFFLKDGSVGVLTEKFREYDGWSAPKSEDMVYVYTDSAFKIKGIKVFDKEKSKWITSDYLFSQYVNSGDDVVFFYRDYEKDETAKEKVWDWNLYINTLIKGEFKQEKIKISSKENWIVPYVAKEGYILFQELNKKEKYNKIRLERLNY
ncbi:hypothetical protein [Flavobacterium sp. GCM10023249]|uniref:hypothetical protein n=1 Tax=unclassified Flavobacterium TaxID=196869 RepID=UPI00360A4E43